MNKKQIIGISIFVALIVLIVGIKAVTGSSDDARKKNLTTVYVATGGGKEDFISDTDIIKILEKKYKLNVVYDSWSNGKTVSKPLIRESVGLGNKEIIDKISNGENVDIVVDYGDGNVEWVKGKTFPKHTYQTAGTYQIKISGTLSDFGNYSESEITAGSNYYTFANYMKKLSKWGELRSIKIWLCKL